MSNLRFLGAVSICLIGFAGGFHQPSHAATLTPDTATPVKAAASSKTPKGIEIVPGSWNLGCKPFGNSGELLCEASRVIVLKKTKKALISVFVSPWKQAKATAPYLLRLQLPHGLDLPAGVSIQVDKDVKHAAIYQTTNQSGVFARLGLSNNTLSAMQAGKILAVNFSAINGNKISIPVSLSGFTAVFSKMK